MHDNAHADSRVWCKGRRAVPTPVPCVVALLAVTLGVGLAGAVSAAEAMPPHHQATPGGGLLQPAADAHAGHAVGHEHRHHHAADTGVERSLANYSPPAVRLMDQHGRRVSLGDLLGKKQPLLLNFLYTSCTAVCPVMAATFARVQSELGTDSGRVRMVSISIDPEHDTPAELAEYARRFKAGPQWTFLTGRLEDVITIQKSFDAYRGDKMNHTPVTLLHAAPDALWVRYDGFVDAADLTREIRVLLSN